MEIFCKNVYTLLASAKPFSAGQASEAKQKLPSEDADLELDLEEQSVKSWCGALENGSIRPAHTKEGSKHLKKRRRLVDGQVRLHNP